MLSQGTILVLRHIQEHLFKYNHHHIHQGRGCYRNCPDEGSITHLLTISDDLWRWRSFIHVPRTPPVQLTETADRLKGTDTPEHWYPRASWNIKNIHILLGGSYCREAKSKAVESLLNMQHKPFFLFYIIGNNSGKNRVYNRRFQLSLTVNVHLRSTGHLVGGKLQDHNCSFCKCSFAKSVCKTVGGCSLSEESTGNLTGIFLTVGRCWCIQT
ncbi:hypothetical protein ATANTOWER_027537 [Ataeniobius toweri]|uniref:Uncharacterized protein n=1 Tax=Ataeniobius toweri TaxID=208326 RepID=A0ABU7B5L5_9TELE|nr:hypothetical protein [Ataeniobius toweri]